MGIIIGAIIGGLVLLMILGGVVGYNSIVKARNAVEQTFADIDVVLKKRYDLIPNLVNTVKGYMKHENDTLSKVIELRNSAIEASSIDDKVEANNKLSGNIDKIIALAENYPDLKADKSFVSLQTSLNNVENEIATQRSRYNASVTNYNNKLDTFPNNILAGMFNFKKSTLFAIVNEKERENIEIKF